MVHPATFPQSLNLHAAFLETAKALIRESQYHVPFIKHDIRQYN